MNIELIENRGKLYQDSVGFHHRKARIKYMVQKYIGIPRLNSFGQHAAVHIVHHQELFSLLDTHRQPFHLNQHYTFRHILHFECYKDLQHLQYEKSEC